MICFHFALKCDAGTKLAAQRVRFQTEAFGNIKLVGSCRKVQVLPQSARSFFKWGFISMAQPCFCSHQVLFLAFPHRTGRENFGRNKPQCDYVWTLGDYCHTLLEVAW